MSKRGMSFLAILLLAVLAVSLPAAAQQQQQAQAPAAQQQEKPRRAVVTFDGKLEDFPKLAPADFELETSKQKFAPARLYGPTDLPTLIAIVLQENQTAEFGTQLSALRDFILSQPPNTYVGLFYLSTQSVETAAFFDSNLKKVADALRAPKGIRELAPPNPYEPLRKIIGGMYRLPDARKEILLFSEGSDAQAGDATAGQNPYLQGAVRDAQESGIPVWVLYTDALPPVGRLARTEAPGSTSSGAPPTNTMGAGASPTGAGGQSSVSSSSSGASQSSVMGGSGAPQGTTTGWDSFGSDTLQPAVQYGVSYLNFLTERSGGKVFSAGKVPPDIRPFLDEFKRLLEQQVVVEYTGSESVKKVKVLRKVQGAKVLAPKR